MSKFYIFLFIIIVSIIGVGIGVSYYLVEKPVVENSRNFINISLAFFDENNITSTGYVLAINTNNNIYSKGITPDSGYLYLTAPVNSSLYIYNYNVLNQTYYTSEFKKLVIDDNNIRADIKLYDIGNCSLNTDGMLINSFQTVNINCVSQLRYPLLCLRWSTHIINTNIINATDYKIPKHLDNKVDKCYKLIMNETIINQSMILSHLDMNNLDNNDYIKLYLVEGDKPYYSPDNIAYDNETGGNLYNDILYIIN